MTPTMAGARRSAARGKTSTVAARFRPPAARRRCNTLGRAHLHVLCERVDQMARPNAEELGGGSADDGRRGQRRTAARRKGRRRRAKPQRTRALDSMGDGDAYGEFGHRGMAAVHRFNGEGWRRLPPLGKKTRPAQPVRKNGRGRRGNGGGAWGAPPCGSTGLGLDGNRRRRGDSCRRPMLLSVCSALAVREEEQRERESRGRGGEDKGTVPCPGFLVTWPGHRSQQGWHRLLCERGRQREQRSRRGGGDDKRARETVTD